MKPNLLIPMSAADILCMYLGCHVITKYGFYTELIRIVSNNE